MSSLFNMPWTQAFDSSGNTLAGAKLYFYEAGTTTPKNIYADAEQTTALTNPAVADGGGRFVPIYVSGGEYKVALYTADDTLIWTADNLESAADESDVDPDAWGAIVQTSQSAGYSESDAQNPANFPKAVAKYASASIYYKDIGTASNYYILEPIGDYAQVGDYYEGMRICFITSRANTAGAVYIAINDLPNVRVRYSKNIINLAAGEILGMVQLVYDGEYFVLDTDTDGKIGDVKMSVVAQAAGHDLRWMLCDGRVLSSTAYPELYAVIGTTFNDSNLNLQEGQFQIPDYRGWILKGYTAYNHGSIAGSESAGLPNIAGSIKLAYGVGYESATHAFEDSTYDTGGLQDGGDSGDGTVIKTADVDFNASNSNALYGASDTVTPANKPIYYYIKAF